MTKDDLITHSSTATRRHRRRRIWAIVGVAAAVSTAASALVPTAWGAQKQDSLQTSLNRLVSRDGFPGATATVTDPDGHVTTYTAGVSKLGSTTAPRPTAWSGSEATPRCSPPS
ncbi:hypothetical protein GCM10025867_11090 [Frondihabitans sucicola]|uniref:Uncharacterized protein n=1 Tax=Frondihabitans sucicola TaxID=1268041 RepID=A0ABN6XV84_9MICO|nr:hypothetical protein [Frondihabitans sucicola]BDZ48868.1 hypothetical protein GCM10025867_11090 [Frondihabitans sucicola]